MNANKYITKLDSKTVAYLENKFFEENTSVALSFSGLSKLVFSPGLYYNHYILNQREDNESQATIEGSLLHCFILEPKALEEKFIIINEKKPSGKPLQVLKSLKEHVDMLKKCSYTGSFELKNFNEKILEIMTDINYNQRMTSDTKKLESMYVHEEYWKFMNESTTKKAIDKETYDLVKKVADLIISDPELRNVLGMNYTSLDNVEVYNEYHLFSPIEESNNFLLNGILDNIIVDHDNKKVYINDLKKTSNTLSKAKDIIDTYDYDVQMAVYKRLVKTNIISKYTENYEIICKFMIVDNYGQVGIVRLSENTMNKAEEKLKNWLYKASVHFENKDFTLPSEFLLNSNKELII